MTVNTAFEPFATWTQLIDHIRAGYALYYHAPMDRQPVRVSAVVRKDGKVRVSPTFSTADPFTADSGHLSRFMRNAGRTA